MALNIASAARKRGWKATGGAGGAVAVAEAIAGGMRGGGFGEGGGGVAEVSDVTVAPNGFINFAAEIGSSSADVSNHELDDPYPTICQLCLCTREFGLLIIAMRCRSRREVSS